MKDLFAQFGIQPTLLIAQIVNFSVLVFVLSKFLYKPIVKAIDKRRATIEHSLKQAKDIEDQHKNAMQTVDKQLAEARKQAEEILAQAKKSADTQRAEIVATAQREAGAIVSKANVQRERDREQMEAEIRSRVGELALAVTEKLLKNHVNKKDLESHLEAVVQQVVTSK